MNKLLIIEDDPYVRKFYERLFKDRDYELLLASNGRDGVSLAKEHLPSLILLDIIMPEMSGMQVLTELKQDESTKKIPIVMLTNIDDIAMIQEAQRNGADGFMVKAYYEPEQLRVHVESLFNHS